MQEGTNQSTKHLFVIYFYRMPMFLNRPRLDLTITQASTFSGARQALFWVTTLPAILNTRSLLLLATGMGKMTLTKKARRGRDSFHFHHGWDLCLSNIFYKQISRPQCMKLTKFMSWEGNPKRSHTFWAKSWDKNFRLIPSRKIAGYCKIPSWKSRDCTFLIPLRLVQH